MQDLQAGNIKSYTQNSFRQMFKDFAIKGLIHCLALWYEFSMDNSTRIEQDTKHRASFLNRGDEGAYTTSHFVALFQDCIRTPIISLCIKLSSVVTKACDVI
ncbi:hypothetical protein Trydic_g23964 [Trypoxylus dichotomus]